jgi:hypothetical protein
MLRYWFIEHPESVGESYFQHQRVALSFALELLGAAVCCLVPAIVPRLFEHAASGKVTQLHQRMATRARVGSKEALVGRGARANVGREVT